MRKRIGTRDRIVAHVRRRIACGDLVAGARLPTRDEHDEQLIRGRGRFASLAEDEND